MSQIDFFRSFDSDYLSRLPNENLYHILEQLDDEDQQYLSWTCKWLYRLVRMNRFGVVSPIWEDAKITNSEILSASCYRDAVVINNILYIPDLMKEKPYCYSINFVQHPLKLIKHPIELDYNTKNHYEPCEFIATAAIDNRLYIFGGKNLNTGEITNNFYELNIITFELKKIENCHHLPKARMMHTLNSIDHHRLALFGGRWCMNGKFYDSREFAIYDTRKNSWTFHNETTFFPSQRSNHSTMFVNGKFYVYGGQQLTSSSKLNRIHDDPDIWEYDVLKLNWRKYLNGWSLSKLLLPNNCISTSGKYPSKRCGAAMFPIRKHIAILGGNEMQNNEEHRSWEYMKILSPTKHTWVHVRIQGMPQIECVSIFTNYKVDTKNIFILGKDQKEGKIVMGWIKDKQT
ncbi:hypothetical protein C1645_732635 [Glomus cerebriforme]|uniref:F-box domain-containing protein n=1 Tax=Glomus cerebriforme TaxID=658196 RepID=A0A397TIR5_9GLOM|nr:hypothetical protein C1645_732635 [Glomus cerebriforme]